MVVHQPGPNICGLPDGYRAVYDMDPGDEPQAANGSRPVSPDAPESWEKQRFRTGRNHARTGQAVMGILEYTSIHPPESIPDPGRGNSIDHSTPFSEPCPLSVSSCGQGVRSLHTLLPSFSFRTSNTANMEGLTLVLLYLALPSLLFSVVKKLVWWRKDSRTKGRFPGPRQFPFVGRVHDLPRYSLWLKFKEWADMYGPIYYTKALDQRFIIISDEEVARELMAKRGHIYSGRAQIRSLIRHKEGPVYSALMDRHGGYSIPLLPFRPSPARTIPGRT